MSAKTRTVRIRVIDSVGTVHGDSGDVQLESGRVAQRIAFGQVLFGSAYCRFTVEGGKNLFRGAGKVGSNVTSDFVAVPAN